MVSLKPPFLSFSIARKFWRRIDLEGDALFVRGMIKGYPNRAQKQALIGSYQTVVVEIVSENGVTGLTEVFPDLVGSTRAWKDIQFAEVVCVEAASVVNNRPVGVGFLSVQGLMRSPIFRPSQYESPIALCDLSFRKIRSEFLEGDAGFGDEQQTTRSPIQSVYGFGLNQRKGMFAGAQVVKQCSPKCAGIISADLKTGGFENHGHVIVLKMNGNAPNVGGNVLRRHTELYAISDLWIVGGRRLF